MFYIQLVYVWQRRRMCTDKKAEFDFIFNHPPPSMRLHIYIHNQNEQISADIIFVIDMAFMTQRSWQIFMFPLNEIFDLWLLHWMRFAMPIKFDFIIVNFFSNFKLPLRHRCGNRTWIRLQYVTTTALHVYILCFRLVDIQRQCAMFVYMIKILLSTRSPPLKLLLYYYFLLLVLEL